MKTKIKKIYLFALVMMVGACGGCQWRGNVELETNVYVIESERLPESFSGYRIAQISDLHNTEFGEDNETLLTMLKESQADAIVLTGDLVDSRRTNVDVAVQFAGKAEEIAPTYYVTGNHEMRIDEYPNLKAGLLDVGVTVLENQAVTVTQGEESIRFIGLQDPACTDEYLDDVERSYVETQLAAFEWGEVYTVLLSHRPEFFETYVEMGTDLVFSGHAHGGQFRLPFVGGLFAPNQGFFPKYTAGLYKDSDTAMLVSRGLGNSLFPLRINNPPEIVVAELKKI